MKFLSVVLCTLRVWFVSLACDDVSVLQAR